MITWLDDATQALPPTALALGPGSEAPGLLAAGGDLSVARLTEAYAHGVFPWYAEGQPVLWWSPDPRMVLFTDEFRLSRSLRKTLARFVVTPGCEVRIDSAFRAVIEACAEAPRGGQRGTWIVPEMIEAYVRWHAAGTVHSVETWIAGELAGGLYVVALGRLVCGESMFARRRDASKIALAALVAFCREHGVTLIDCQQRTGHLASLGAREIARVEFERHVARSARDLPIADWTYHRSTWRQLGLRTVEPPATKPSEDPAR
ncbi:MAG: leucyl/phenylalanyl-tRNA--protein transferase [Betaproteobacteria bacterium]